MEMKMIWDGTQEYMEDKWSGVYEYKDKMTLWQAIWESTVNKVEWHEAHNILSTLKCKKQCAMRDRRESTSIFGTRQFYNNM